MVEIFIGASSVAFQVQMAAAKLREDFAAIDENQRMREAWLLRLTGRKSMYQASRLAMLKLSSVSLCYAIKHLSML
eukprot:3437777-Rhodomonas_salina.2